MRVSKRLLLKVVGIPLLVVLVLAGGVTALGAYNSAHAVKQATTRAISGDYADASQTDDLQKQLDSANSDLQDSKDTYNKLKSAVLEEHDSEINRLIFQYCGKAPAGAFPTPELGKYTPPTAYQTCVQGQMDGYIDSFVTKYSVI